MFTRTVQVTGGGGGAKDTIYLNKPLEVFSNRSMLGGHETKFAFDGDDTTYAEISSGASDVGYGIDFVNPVVITSVEILMSYSVISGKVQYSDTKNDNDWHDASETFVPSTTKTAHLVTNTQAHRYWRIYMTGSNSSFMTKTIDLYGYYE